MQERLEVSRGGRALISAFVVVTLLAVVAFNLPASELRRQSMRLFEPYMIATGLDQNWSVFAPDPRREVIELQARITYGDGSPPRTWRVPRGNPVIGVYWDYRWLKWAEWMTAEGDPHLWKPAAQWITRREHAEGRQPLTVALVRRSYALNPPGVSPPHGKWQEYELFNYSVGRSAPRPVG